LEAGMEGEEIYASLSTEADSFKNLTEM